VPGHRGDGIAEFLPSYPGISVNHIEETGRMVTRKSEALQDKGQSPMPAEISSRSQQKPNSILRQKGAFLEPERRQAMIAEAAYFQAEHRGFESGHELEDWYEAEKEIDAKFANNGRTANGI